MTEEMRTSKVGIELIKRYEGFRADAYKCVPTERYYTIGYGHYGADVNPNDIITKDEATALLQNDLLKYERKVNRYQDLYQFTQIEFDALVSFCYNIGSIDKLTNYGKRTKSEIANAMMLYVRSGGRVLDGLVRRRKEESLLFKQGNLYENKCKTYPIYTGESVKIDEILKAIGVASRYIGNYKRRRPLAEANCISNYKGTAMQNCKLIALAKSGNLKRVE